LAQRGRNRVLGEVHAHARGGRDRWLARIEASGYRVQWFERKADEKVDATLRRFRDCYGVFAAAQQALVEAGAGAQQESDS
jgi:hypothetical protein